ncbi:MAG: hypothetical protein WBI48_11330, partial [Thermacetogeniaceae bacterium]
VAAYTILYYLNVGSTVTTIISILTGLATGGLSLMSILTTSGQQSCDIRAAFSSHPATIPAISGQ